MEPLLPEGDSPGALQHLDYLGAYLFSDTPRLSNTPAAIPSASRTRRKQRCSCNVLCSGDEAGASHGKLDDARGAGDRPILPTPASRPRPILTRGRPPCAARYRLVSNAALRSLLARADRKCSVPVMCVEALSFFLFERRTLRALGKFIKNRCHI